jgi:hypothetical protein
VRKFVHSRYKRSSLFLHFGLPDLKHIILACYYCRLVTQFEPVLFANQMLGIFLKRLYMTIYISFVFHVCSSL